MVRETLPVPGSTEIAMEEMVNMEDKPDVALSESTHVVLNAAPGSDPSRVASSRVDDGDAQAAQQVLSDAEIDIFVASQLGKTEQIRALIESGRARATDTDDDRITPLHLAAINGRIEACAYLIEQGADVNALGGDSAGTPLHWAGRNGLVEIIDLLIRHGADPCLFDSQGYNCLHSVVHSSNYWAVLYILVCQPDVDVDERDRRMGHTPLHRAVYQGDEVATQILLKMGADPKVRDRDGLTVLHWAAFSGNRGCITQLLEAGADIRAKARDGRTAQEISAEHGNEDIWKSVVGELGFKPDGTRVRRPLSEPGVNIIVFSVPTISIGVTFTTMVVFPVYMAIVISPLVFFYINFTQITRLVRRDAIKEDLRKIPTFFGMVVGTAILMTYIWVTRLRFDAPHNPAMHAAFIFLLVLFVLAVLRTAFSDPGICATETKDSLKPTIEDLARGKRLSPEVFCIECLALKLPQSKHCSICNKCVTFLKISNVHSLYMLNCVGVKNYKYFVVFILSILADVLVFGYLTGIYLLTDVLAALNGDIPFKKLDRFLITITIWIALSTLITIVRILWVILMGRLRDTRLKGPGVAGSRDIAMDWFFRKWLVTTDNLST